MQENSTDASRGTPPVRPIPAFNDNYIWLLENGDGTALVVDPGDAAAVEAALAASDLRLAGILITHHHFDHVGGLLALKDAHGCRVYGPDNPGIAGIDETLADGDRLTVGAYDFRIIAVPGHTLDHIAYFQDGDPPLLFCGDTLFAGGCGRIFEGTAPMMHASLERLAGLPGATLVYCAHEYTLANLAFARTADPDNESLARRDEEAHALRAAGEPTVPSTIALERATNPFLRSGDAALARGLVTAGRAPGDQPVQTFAALRAWKDSF